MYKGIEKRNHKRIEKPYTARFRIKQHDGSETSFPDGEVILSDISTGGALFFYNKDLGIGTLLDLKIDFFKPIPSINCIGRVVRIEKPMPDSMFNIAVKFIDIGEQEKETINKAVKGILE